MSRMIEVSVTDASKTIDIPFLAVAKGGVLGQHFGPMGEICYGYTDAIENIHYALPKTETVIRYENSIFSFPVKLYPERITKPMTITFIGVGFRDNSDLAEQGSVIDTVTINLVPQVQ